MAEKNQRTMTLLTAKDLADMGEEGEFCELVDGELVRMSPSFLPEARVVRTVQRILDNFVFPRHLVQLVTIKYPIIMLPWQAPRP
jgi:hypothetical protein